MTAVAIAGIVLSLAVPSFRAFHRTNAMAAAANDLVTGALLARSEAVKRQVPVTLCITDDAAAAVPSCASDADGAFVVFVDENGNGATDATDGNAAVDMGETVLLRSPAPGGQIRVWMDNHFVTYGANGFPSGASATRLLFCDDRGTRVEAGGQSAARVMLFEPTGRGSIRAEADIVQLAVEALDPACGA